MFFLQAVQGISAKCSVCNQRNRGVDGFGVQVGILQREWLVFFFQVDRNAPRCFDNGKLYFFDGEHLIATQGSHEVINGKPQLSHGILFDLSISDDNFRAAANYTPQTAALEGKPRNDDFKTNHRQNGQNAGQQGNGSVF